MQSHRHLYDSIDVRIIKELFECFHVSAVTVTAHEILAGLAVAPVMRLNLDRSQRLRGGPDFRSHTSSAPIIPQLTVFIYAPFKKQLYSTDNIFQSSPSPSKYQEGTTANSITPLL